MNATIQSLDGSETYTISPAKLSQVDALKTLCDETLGYDFYCTDDLREFINDDNGFFYVLEYNNEIVGYHYHYLAALEDVAQSLKCDLNEMSRASGCKAEQTVGVLKSIGVRNSYRGRGLAYAFNQCAIDSLFAMGMPSIWVPAWMHNDYIPENNTLLKQGFQAFNKVSMLWHDHPRLRCPICGDEHCSCNAMIYYSVKK